MKLSQLETIGVKFITLLTEAGIDDQDKLLIICRRRQGREALANATGINLKLIFKWTIYADLSRISGIGEDFAELLEHGHIYSVKDLAQSNSEKLHEELCNINEQMQLVRQLPSLNQVQSWIKQAQKLPPILDN